MSKRQRHDEDDDDGSEVDSGQLISESFSPIFCNTPPCRELKFSSYEMYESHILSNHSHKCSECKKRFPSEFMLELHIEENHNPFFTIKKEKGEKVYRCFESTCSKVSSERRKRRLHMIDKHGYPKNYRFNIVDTGLNKTTSLLR
ncbi:hypothetical protein CLIB1423_01S09252 [[Candida] railenensis]|uniref:C2H2-type domain-containing protein n=1 Tax=[Candida] railenensis TaxID=45579 RepID=A0A9P0QKW6_9ASCO|nr:hypothetical protein CLIB1423_01S09252 [[Candida] railenensis]